MRQATVWRSLPADVRAEVRAQTVAACQLRADDAAAVGLRAAGLLEGLRGTVTFVVAGRRVVWRSRAFVELVDRAVRRRWVLLGLGAGQGRPMTAD
jgi:hypothetical protein